MNLVEKLAAEGHLTSEQVERIGNNVHSFLDAIDKDPALYKEAVEKLSGPLDALKKVFSREGMENAATRTLEYAPYALATAGAGALMGGAVEAGRSGIQALRNSIDKSKAYRSMLEENPQLANNDPNITEKAFNTLYRFNPHYAKDPLVAGTFVKNIVDQERLDIGTVSNLVSAHKAIQESKGRGPGMSEFFMKAMQGGMKGGGKPGGDGEESAADTYFRNMASAEAAREAAEKARGDFFSSTEQVSADDPRVHK